MYIRKWYDDLDSAQKPSWKCDICKSKKLDIARNCKGQYGKTNIVLTRAKIVHQCPISMLSTDCSSIYELIKMTLLSEFASFKPSELIEELNIYLVYAGVISNAESDYNEHTKKREKRGKK